MFCIIYQLYSCDLQTPTQLFCSCRIFYSHSLLAFAHMLAQSLHHHCNSITVPFLTFAFFALPPLCACCWPLGRWAPLVWVAEEQYWLRSSRAVSEKEASSSAPPSSQSGSPCTAAVLIVLTWASHSSAKLSLKQMSQFSAICAHLFLFTFFIFLKTEHIIQFIQNVIANWHVDHQNFYYGCSNHLMHILKIQKMPIFLF